MNERLRLIRENMELSQRQMAKQLNISKSTYARWETGENTIPLKHLADFCNLTMINIDYVTKLSNNKKLDKKIRIDKVKIGKNLKKVRLENHLTQKELANMLNTTQSVISDYENGNTLIQTSFLIDTCNKCNVSINVIVKGKD